MDNAEKILASIVAQFGEITVARLSAEPAPVEVVSSGVLSVDRALVVGGFPRQRITTIYGPECIDEDSFIQYEVRTKDGRRQNHKGGTIKHLYKRFHKIERLGAGHYQRPSSIDSEFWAPSITENGGIMQNCILDVIHCGEKDCYRVTTESGASLISTLEHEFYTGDRFVPLKDLEKDDCIYIHNGTHYTTAGAGKTKNRPEVFVKYHPGWPTKLISGQYKYYRGKKSHAVMEALVNGLEYTEYIHLLNTGAPEDIDALWFVPSGYHMHHVDTNPENNARDNLILMDGPGHNRMHALENHEKLRYTVIPDTIESIEWVGMRDTYDLRMETPRHNYIANNIVVHNSGGKTTLVLWTIGKALKAGLRCVFIDVEQGGSEEYFYSCFEHAGVTNIEAHINDNSLIVLRPETAEAALEAAKALIPITDFMVIDSISSLTPTVVLDTEAGRHTIGVDARFQTTEFKKVKSILGAHDCALVIISQVRTNIGGYGAPETTTEPKAVRHIASVRMRVSKDGGFRAEGGRPVAQPVKVDVKKNKVGIPHMKASFEIVFGQGVDAEKDTLDAAVEAGIMRSGGGHYRYPNSDKAADWLMDIRGKVEAANWLRVHQDVYSQIYTELLG